jgi:PAS domain S-box-containing protein
MTVRELTVLIVEDSEDDAMLAAAALERADHQVRWRRVDGAGQMARALEEEHWDVVLCDHVLPQFDSVAALGVLAASACAAPLIVVSGAIGEEAAAAAIRCGAADYVGKDHLSRLAAVVDTQLSHAELSAAQRRAEAQFRSAFDDAPFGSAVVALAADTGRLLRVNRALCKATGYTERRLLESRVQDLLHPDYMQDLENGLALLREGDRRTYRAEGRLLDAAGEELWVLFSISPVREPGGHDAVAQFIDIADRKRVEEAMRHANEEVLESSRLKSEFVANMSHEIRTPLNGVIGLGELLGDTDLNADQRKYVAGIRGSGQALMSVISAVLDFSKMDSGEPTLDRADFDPAKIVAEACAILAPTAAAKGLRLTRSIDASVPDLAHADAGRIRQVLINLVDNAVKFTEAGEVVVGLSVPAHRPATLCFEVTDTGPGVGSTERLFEPFWQDDSSVTRRHGGTGLGLAIVKQMLTLMGGAIDFETTLGVGSHVSFSIPFATAQGADAPTELAGIRALVVDNDATHLLISQHQLSWGGIRVTPVGGSAAALVALEAAADAGDPYQIAMIDLAMAKMDGLELTAAIRANTKVADTRVLLLTSMPVSREALEKAGADSTLIKPVGREQLIAEVTHVLGARETATPVAENGSIVHAPRNTGRLLLAEDDESSQLYATHLLEHDGWQVKLARNGREAVAFAASDTYDAILMDCQMPELDGYSATGEIRRHEGAKRHTPIIALTAHASEQDRARCLDAGMDDYITKPVSPATIGVALQRALDASPRAVARSPTSRKRVSPPRSKRLAPLLDARPLAFVSQTDPAAGKRFADLFVHTARQYIRELAEAEAVGDGATVQSIVHTLKGSAATIGATRMRQKCELLGKAAASGRATDISARQSDLETAFTLTEAALQTNNRKTSNDKNDNT